MGLNARRVPWGWLPNALCVARILLTVLTWAAALQHDLPAFVILVLVIVMTDLYDGPIARRLKVADSAGANLDSFSDLTFYASLPVWVYLWRPDDVIAHLGVIGTSTALYLLALAIGRARRGLLGFHNWATRASGTAGVVFALCTILWGWFDALAYGVLLMVALDLGLRYRRLFFEPRTLGAAPRED